MSFFRKELSPNSSPPEMKRSKQFIPSKEPHQESFIPPSVQTKLAIGKSNDTYEKEADRVADKVVSQSKVDAVQKKEGDEEIQQKPIASEVTPLVQKSVASEE